jgi:hypothetical protein
MNVWDKYLKELSDAGYCICSGVKEQAKNCKSLREFWKALSNHDKDYQLFCENYGLYIETITPLLYEAYVTLCTYHGISIKYSLFDFKARSYGDILVLLERIVFKEYGYKFMATSDLEEIFESLGMEDYVDHLFEKYFTFEVGKQLYKTLCDFYDITPKHIGE